MAATTMASGRSTPASSRAARAASAMRSGRLSSRLPKRVMPAPVIQTLLTRPFQTALPRVSMSLRSLAGGSVLPGWHRDGGRPAGHAHAELAHEAQEIGPLEPQRPRRLGPVAAELGERRLDEPALELGDGAVEPRRRLRKARGLRGKGSGSRCDGAHAPDPGQAV